MRFSLGRSLLLILVVRAIFLAPAAASEHGGPARRLGDASLKTRDLVRPTRLRYLQPRIRSALEERMDCKDGGDDDERDFRPLRSTSPWSRLEALPRVAPTHPTLPSLPLAAVHLRC